MDWNRIKHGPLTAHTVLMVIGKEWKDWMRYPVYRECLVCLVSLRVN